MQHKDLTLNHRLESWVYANAADRLAATGFVPGDISRIAYQQDNGSYWRLTATTPAWVAIFPLSTVTYISAVLSPATVTGTTAAPKMIGLAGTFTPARSGKIFVVINGNTLVTAGVDTGSILARWGTGAAPVNGAVATGSNFGGGVSATSSVANNRLPFCAGGLIIGLTLGVPIWIDLSYGTIGGIAGGVAAVVISAFELP